MIFVITFFLTQSCFKCFYKANITYIQIKYIYVQIITSNIMSQIDIMLGWALHKMAQTDHI